MWRVYILVWSVECEVCGSSVECLHLVLSMYDQCVRFTSSEVFRVWVVYSKWGCVLLVSLSIPECSWVFLSVPECPWVSLSISEYPPAVPSLPTDCYKIEGFLWFAQISHLLRVLMNLALFLPWPFAWKAKPWSWSLLFQQEGDILILRGWVRTSRAPIVWLTDWLQLFWQHATVLTSRFWASKSLK